MNTLGLALILAPVFVVLAIARNQKRRSATRSATVEIVADRDGVRRTLADDRHEGVAWDEITRVEVFTTRIGPHKEAGGAVVLYGDETRGCIVPLDRLGDSKLLDHIGGRLPGFVLTKLINATLEDERTSNDPTALAATYFKPKPLQTTIVVWRREDHEDRTDPADA